MKRNKTVLVAMCVTAVSSWAGNTLSAVNTWVISALLMCVACFGTATLSAQQANLVWGHERPQVVTEYRVYRSSEDTGEWNLKAVVTEQNWTDNLDETVPATAPYVWFCYRVTAANEHGESEPSNAVAFSRATERKKLECSDPDAVPPDGPIELGFAPEK